MWLLHRAGPANELTGRYEVLLTFMAVRARPALTPDADDYALYAGARPASHIVDYRADTGRARSSPPPPVRGSEPSS